MKVIAPRTLLLVASFGLLAAAGCTSDSSSKPAPAPSPQPAPAPEATAKPPDDLTSLQEKLQPPAAPARPAPAFDEAALLSGAEGAVKAWVKEVDADNDRAVRAACLDQADLEKVAGEGLQNILSSSLLPENV